MPFSINDLPDEDRKAAARFLERRDAISATQKLIAQGRGLLAESDDRRDAFASRVRGLAAQPPEMRMGAPIGIRPPDLDAGVDEKTIGKTYDIVSTEFFEAGLLAQRAVGRINTDTGHGTGFLVGHGLLLTNNHVLPSVADAAGATLDMDAEHDLIAPSARTKQYHFDPATFFLTDRERDITLVKVTDFVGDKPALETFGWHVLIAAQGKIRVGDPVNIIQHPDGRDKSVTVHNSHVLHLADEGEDTQYCWYTGDTEGGSSGSPVFNNMWEVVAIHHRAIRRTDATGAILDRNGKRMSDDRARERPEEIDYIANEGVRASHVVRAIEEADLSGAMDESRKELLRMWQRPGAQARAVAAIDRQSRFA